MGFTSLLASKLDTSEEAINLFATLLLSYPICIAFNTHFITKSKNTKLFYYFFFGLSLVYFNFGLNAIHSLVICLFCYTTISVFSIETALALNFTIPLIYQIYGCYVTQIGSNYTITWTLPQCVLILKLIAITFDIYDGIKIKRSLQKFPTNAWVANNSDTALKSVPTLLEFLSHCYFPATVLVGPLIPYREYIDYIESDVSQLSKCWKRSLNRLLLGFLYLTVFVFGSLYWPTDYLLGEEFAQELSFWQRINAILIVGKFCSSKYLMSWLISEGACIVSGLAYDGKDHTSCANIEVLRCETSWTVGRMIKSFNLKTNYFVAKYVYKRLKFMGNKTLSKAITLTFLSLWHGLDTGYFMAFGMEFLIMKMETEVTAKVAAIRRKRPTIDRLLNNLIVKYLVYLSLRLYAIYLLSYSYVPFMLIKTDIWYPVLREVYFFGHLITMSWFIIALFV